MGVTCSGPIKFVDASTTIETAAFWMAEAFVCGCAWQIVQGTGKSKIEQTDSMKDFTTCT
jgi:hypothetical protein